MKILSLCVKKEEKKIFDVDRRISTSTYGRAGLRLEIDLVDIEKDIKIKISLPLERIRKNMKKNY